MARYCPPEQLLKHITSVELPVYKKTYQQQLPSRAVLKSEANVNYAQLSDKVVNVFMFNRGSSCGQQQQQIVIQSHLLRVQQEIPFDNSEQQLFCHR